MFQLKLYVVGQKPKVSESISNLRVLLEEKVRDRYLLEVIDLLENPQLGEDERIFVTPTLVKLLPPPVRRIIGDFSDGEKVLTALGLVPNEGKI